VLNWEKCYFVQEGVVLGRVISHKGNEVDKEKIEVVERLLPSTCVKGVRSFLGHASFHRHLIKDFSKIAKPLTVPLAKDTSMSVLKHLLGSRRPLSTLPLSNHPIRAFLLRLCTMLVTMRLEWF